MNKNVRILPLLWLLFFCSPAAAEIITGSGGVPESDKQGASLNSTLRKAKKQLAAGDLDAARGILKDFSDQTPDSLAPEIQLASLLFDLQRPDLGHRLLNDYALGNANSSESHFAYARLAAMAQRWVDADAHLKLSRSGAMPRRWSAEYRLEMQTAFVKLSANVAIQRGNWKEAKRLFEAICERDSDDLESLTGLANSQFHLDEHEQALQTLRLLQEREPTPLPAELRMAKLFQTSGNATQTETWFRKAITADTGFQSSGEFGLWLVDQNRSQEALDLIGQDERSALNSQSANSHNLVAGLSHRMLGQFSDAETLFSGLHRSAPDNWLYSNQLALVLIESEDEGKRGRALQIATQNAGQLTIADTLATLGWIKYRLGDARTAEELLANAITNRPDIPGDAFLFLAEVKSQLGKTDEARTLQQIAGSVVGPRYYKTKSE